MANRTPYNFSYNVRGRVNHAVRAGTVGAARGMVELAAALQHQAGNRSEFKKAMEFVAAAMKAEVLEEYRGTVRQGNSYREGNRNSGGLRRVLNDPKFIRATSDGIDFVNSQMLREYASHWKRLNFGAGAAGNTQSPHYTLRYAGRYVTDLYFRIPVQPGFQIPKGYFEHGSKKVGPKGEFRGQSTGRHFYPKSQIMLGETVGIQGRHFMEAGFVALAREFPIAMEALIDRAVTNQTKSGKAVQKVRVNTSNPFTGRRFRS